VIGRPRRIGNKEAASAGFNLAAAKQKTAAGSETALLLAAVGALSRRAKYS